MFLSLTGSDYFFFATVLGLSWVFFFPDSMRNDFGFSFERFLDCYFQSKPPFCIDVMTAGGSSCPPYCHSLGASHFCFTFVVRAANWSSGAAMPIQIRFLFLRCISDYECRLLDLEFGFLSITVATSLCMNGATPFANSHMICQSWFCCCDFDFRYSFCCVHHHWHSPRHSLELFWT